MKAADVFIAAFRAGTGNKPVMYGTPYWRGLLDTLERLEITGPEVEPIKAPYPEVDRIQLYSMGANEAQRLWRINQ